MKFLFYYTCFICGAVFYFYGWFGLDFSPKLYTNNEKRPANADINRSPVPGVVLLIIDALRYDFISEEYMPNTWKLIQENEACLVKIRTSVPTVTLPRIKSLTTGTIPQFTDIIFNFGNRSLNTDSVIHQMYKRGDQIAFYGDNTWTNLFPGMFYKSFENTDSFFVQDFYEGDKNITKGVIENELVHNKTWDHLILHYLGLDHIGHVEGPFSPKIQIKLREMDDILHKIVNFSKKHRILTVATGDHGMRSSGGHGGSTAEEIFVPMVIFGPADCRKNKKREYYNQIDFAPSISFYLGLDVPEDSIGSIIPQLISKLDKETILKSYYLNSKHLNLKVGSDRSSFEEYIKSYSFGKSSYDRYKTTQLPRDYVESLYHFEQASRGMSRQLSSRVDTTATENVLFGLFVCILSFALLFSNVCSFRNLNSRKYSLQNYGITVISMVSIVHAISFASSSFIEEEHQTWYYVTNTMLILLCIISISKIKSYNLYRWIVILLMNWFCRKLNRTGDKWINLPDIGDWLQLEEHAGLRLLTAAIGVGLLLHFLYENDGCRRMPYLEAIGGTSILNYRFNVIPPITPHISLVILCVVMVIKALSMKSHLSVLSLLCVLLHRPHNIILVPVELYTLKHVYKTFDILQTTSLTRKSSTIWKTAFTFWISKTFYFYQGNSNNFATIDVNAGFIGVEQFILPLAAILTLVNTFSSQILAALTILESILTDDNFINFKHQYAKFSFMLHATLVAFPLVIYLIFMIFFKNHLFIWTVFAPKFCYELSHSIIFFIIFIIVEISINTIY